MHNEACQRLVYFLWLLRCVAVAVRNRFVISLQVRVRWPTDLSLSRRDSDVQKLLSPPDWPELIFHKSMPHTLWMPLKCFTEWVRMRVWMWVSVRMANAMWIWVLYSWRQCLCCFVAFGMPQKLCTNRGPALCKFMLCLGQFFFFKCIFWQAKVAGNWKVHQALAYNFLNASLAGLDQSSCAESLRSTCVQNK